MYEYIRGIYKGFKKDYIVIENSGIGYRVFTSGSTMAMLPEVNSEAEVYIKQIVRQDFMGLYGFVTEGELELFNMLININGVGAKAALSILSLGNVNNIKLAIATSDEAYVIKAAGIGKKTAQRIILELKDKLSKDQLVSSQIDAGDNSEVDKFKLVEVREALLALGYKETEIDKASKELDLTLSIENIIRQALRVLMN